VADQGIIAGSARQQRRSPDYLILSGASGLGRQQEGEKAEAGQAVRPPKKGESVADPTHGVLHGYLLRERFKALGVDLRVEQWPGSARKMTPEWKARIKQTLVDYLKK